jgi:putative glutamine amidotransferase
MVRWKIAVSFGEKTKRQPYQEALRKVEIEFVENPETMDGLAGLMLTGGTDVDPARYGQKNVHSDPPDRERDKREAALLRDALERDIPILAICRGMQLVNVVLGGSLQQNIANHRHPAVADAHEIEIFDQTKLASILKAGPYQVNSRHHQCVARLGEGLVKSAAAADGIVEGLEFPAKRFAVAVQWHPEDRLDGPDRKLFEAFRDAII